MNALIEKEKPCFCEPNPFQCKAGCLCVGCGCLKERPILFSAPMILALLAGTKTQTRRIVKFKGKPPTVAEAKRRYGLAGFTLEAGFFGVRCRYGMPRDHLWVRETWKSWVETCRDDHGDDDCEPHCNQTYVAYAATPRKGFRPKPDGVAITFLDESSPLTQRRELLGPWKPSIHMPRWASRISLEVARVSVEPLQDITREDAIAEGIERTDVVINGHNDGTRYRDYAGPNDPCEWFADPRDSYRSLWESINGAGSWKKNPWVWVVKFKKTSGASTPQPPGET